MKPAHMAAMRMSPPLADAPLRLYVATNGNDAWSGTQPDPDETRNDGPFATLDRARTEIRRLRDQGQPPPGGLAVFIRGGNYPVSNTLTLTAADSGTMDAPILYRSFPGETPIFQGGVRLTDFQPVTDPAILARLPAQSAHMIRQVDLKASGATSIIPFQLGGFASGSGFLTHPVMELFCNGAPQPRSRWPKTGYMRIEEVSSNATYVSHGLTGSMTGPFTYSDDRPARWIDEKYAMLQGYWFWDWADSHERVASIDPVRREITLAPPYSRYGYRKGQRFRAVNLLCEIEEPGEWYIDEERGILYVYPPVELSAATVEISVIATPFIHFENVSHVTLQGLTWELGATDAILLEDGDNCKLVGCTIRRCAGNGVEFRGGTGHELRSCDLYSMGRGGAVIIGGNRRTLTPGGHVVENCHIYDLSRVDRTYTPAVVAKGVGQRIAHNRMHHIPSSAIRLGGNDHIVEFNEIHDVVLESDDQGGIDMFGDPTYRGNIIRYNYWHHIGDWQGDGKGLREGQAGIRLDDAISGVLIEGNLFHHCGVGHFGAVQIHGGKDNTVIRNAFIQCRAAVSFSAWGDQHWRDFIAKPINEPEIDPVLATNRYPELAHLTEDHDRNLVTRNLIYACDKVSLRPSERSVIEENLVTDMNPGYRDVEHGDFRLAPSALASPDPGIPSIPFEKIGLYRDADRPALPTTNSPAGPT